MKYWLGVGFSLCLFVERADAGKLSDLREETGSSSSSPSGSGGADDDGCSFLAALFTDCDEPPTYSYRVMPTPHDTSAPPPAGAQLLPPWYFPLYPYRSRALGNLERRRYPLDLEPSLCSALDADCLQRTGTVTCVDNTCYAPSPPEVSSEVNDGVVDPVGAEEWRAVDRLQSARLQLQFDGGADREGLLRTTIGGSVDSNRSWGLETRFTYWLETLPQGGTDGAWIGDVNIRYAVLMLPALQLRLGLGPRILTDSHAKTGGINGTVGLELYPVRPIVLRLDTDVGTLGEALVLESQASLGVLLWRAELLAGAATLRVGAVEFDSLFAGVRFHL